MRAPPIANITTTSTFCTRALEQIGLRVSGVCGVVWQRGASGCLSEAALLQGTPCCVIARVIHVLPGLQSVRHWRGLGLHSAPHCHERFPRAAVVTASQAPSRIGCTLQKQQHGAAGQQQAAREGCLPHPNRRGELLGECWFSHAQSVHGAGSVCMGPNKHTQSKLPRKKFYRARAHSNPLNVSELNAPENPDAMDWCVWCVWGRVYVCKGRMQQRAAACAAPRNNPGHSTFRRSSSSSRISWCGLRTLGAGLAGCSSSWHPNTQTR